MRARGSLLRTADPGGHIAVAGHLPDPRTQRFGVGARVDGIAVELVKRGRDAGTRPDHARAWGDLRERDPKPRRRGRIA